MAQVGHYERKQIHCRSHVIAWSHRSRFRQACRLVEPYAGQRLLDYGCGDGAFLKMVAESFPGAVGADTAHDQIEDCRRRLAPLSFVAVDELEGAFDVVTCMEVLEHCPDEEAEQVLLDLHRLTRGVLIISVPVETGPTILFKQAVRRVAGWRGLGDYKWTERYTWRELLTMAFATGRTKITRPLHGEAHPQHTHKGFNWRALENRIRRRFDITGRHFTPLGFLGGYFSSQVWFVCRPKK